MLSADRVLPAYSIRTDLYVAVFGFLGERERHRAAVQRFSRDDLIFGRTRDAGLLGDWKMKSGVTRNWEIRSEPKAEYMEMKKFRTRKHAMGEQRE